MNLNAFRRFMCSIHFHMQKCFSIKADVIKLLCITYSREGDGQRIWGKWRNENTFLGVFGCIKFIYAFLRFVVKFALIVWWVRVVWSFGLTLNLLVGPTLSLSVLLSLSADHIPFSLSPVVTCGPFVCWPHKHNKLVVNFLFVASAPFVCLLVALLRTSPHSRVTQPPPLIRQRRPFDHAHNALQISVLWRRLSCGMDKSKSLTRCDKDFFIFYLPPGK